MFKTQRSVAMDAASSSGMAFLSSQLELMDPKLVEPLAAVTHPRDMIIKSGGGYPEFTSAYAADFATTGGNQFGLQGTEATDQAVVQTSINKGVWPTNIFSAAQLIPYVDLQRLMEAGRSGIPAPFSLQSLLDQGVKLIWGKAMDRVTYLGWNGQPGLINNTNIAYSIAPNGASGFPQWTKKTTTEILNDFNTVLLATQSGSGYDTAGLADTVPGGLHPLEHVNQPMTIGAYNSLLEYILANMARRVHGRQRAFGNQPEAGDRVRQIGQRLFVERVPPDIRDGLVEGLGGLVNPLDEGVGRPGRRLEVKGCFRRDRVPILEISADAVGEHNGDILVAEKAGLLDHELGVGANPVLAINAQGDGGVGAFGNKLNLRDRADLHTGQQHGRPGL